MELSKTMKAAVATGKGRLEVWDVPLPAFGEYEALVRLCYGATCAGTDQRIVEGGHPFPIHYPGVLGHESVGRVLRTGDKVSFFQEGDLISRVGTVPDPSMDLGICWGGFAEYGVATDWRAMERDGLPPETWQRFRVQQVIPPDIAPEAAPMITTWRETLSYVNRLGVRQGETVLVAGSGANALAMVCHAAYAGAQVVAMGNAARMARFIGAGAAAGIDYRAGDLLAQIASACPDGLHYIIDAVGYSGNVNLALPLLRENGTVAVYGWHARGAYGIQPFAAKHSFQVYCDGYDEAETHDQVMGRIREGALRAGDWYDLEHPIPLADIAKAYQDLLDRKALKYLIRLP